MQVICDALRVNPADLEILFIAMSYVIVSWDNIAAILCLMNILLPKAHRYLPTWDFLDKLRDIYLLK